MTRPQRKKQAPQNSAIAAGTERSARAARRNKNKKRQSFDGEGDVARPSGSTQRLLRDDSGLQDLDPDVAAKFQSRGLVLRLQNPTRNESKQAEEQSLAQIYFTINSYPELKTGKEAMLDEDVATYLVELYQEIAEHADGKEIYHFHTRDHKEDKSRDKKLLHKKKVCKAVCKNSGFFIAKAMTQNHMKKLIVQAVEMLPPTREEAVEIATPSKSTNSGRNSQGGENEIVAPGGDEEPLAVSGHGKKPSTVSQTLTAEKPSAVASAGVASASSPGDKKRSSESGPPTTGADKISAKSGDLDEKSLSHEDQNKAAAADVEELVDPGLGLVNDPPGGSLDHGDGKPSAAAASSPEDNSKEIQKVEKAHQISEDLAGWMEKIEKLDVKRIMELLRAPFLDPTKAKSSSDDLKPTWDESSSDDLAALKHVEPALKLLKDTLQDLSGCTASNSSEVELKLLFIQAKLLIKMGLEDQVIANSKVEEKLPHLRVQAFMAAGKFFDAQGVVRKMNEVPKFCDLEELKRLKKFLKRGELCDRFFETYDRENVDDGSYKVSFDLLVDYYRKAGAGFGFTLLHELMLRELMRRNLLEGRSEAARVTNFCFGLVQIRLAEDRARRVVAEEQVEAALSDDLQETAQRRAESCEQNPKYEGWNLPQFGANFLRLLPDFAQKASVRGLVLQAGITDEAKKTAKSAIICLLDINGDEDGFAEKEDENFRKFLSYLELGDSLFDRAITRPQDYEDCLPAARLVYETALTMRWDVTFVPGHETSAPLGGLLRSQVLSGLAHCYTEELADLPEDQKKKEQRTSPFYDKALACYKEALEINPDFLTAQRGFAKLCGLQYKFTKKNIYAADAMSAYLKCFLAIRKSNCNDDIVQLKPVVDNIRLVMRLLVPGRDDGVYSFNLDKFKIKPLGDWETCCCIIGARYEGFYSPASIISMVTKARQAVFALHPEKWQQYAGKFTRVLPEDVWCSAQASITDVYNFVHNAFCYFSACEERYLKNDI